jgi:FK506-binding protein 2
VKKFGIIVVSYKMLNVPLLCVLLLISLLSVVATASSAVEQLRIGIKQHAKDGCKEKAQNGDTVRVHYTGMLKKDKSVFDSSLDRGDPFAFTLGQGQVIQGWDQGILGMCVGEKRRLTIPPHLGYGDRGAGEKIPGGSTLVFDVV